MDDISRNRIINHFPNGQKIANTIMDLERRRCVVRVEVDPEAKIIRMIYRDSMANECTIRKLMKRAGAKELDEERARVFLARF